MLANDKNRFQKRYIYKKSRRFETKTTKSDLDNHDRRIRREAAKPLSSIENVANTDKNKINDESEKAVTAAEESTQILPEKDYKSNLNSYHNYNSYSYQYHPNSYNSRYKQQQTRYDYLKMKLSDLINPDRNKTFIDNLYAQFQLNSNQISLLYVPPNEKPPDNTILLSNSILNNDYSTNQLTNTNRVDSNKILNDFYLNAIKYKSNSNFFFVSYSLICPKIIFLFQKISASINIF
jgi:hypothetical protein